MKKNTFLTLAICLSALVFSMTAAAQQRFVANLIGVQVVPANFSTGKGVCEIALSGNQTQALVSCSYSGLSSPVSQVHIHTGAPIGTNSPVTFTLNSTSGTTGTTTPTTINLLPVNVASLRAKQWYFDIHTANFPDGEVRGQAKITTTPDDYDGDGRSDVAVFRQSNNTFYSISSLTGGINSILFGTSSGDNYLNGYEHDLDGDGKSDALLLKIDQTNGNGLWNYLRSSDNISNSVTFGAFLTSNTERLVPGDYDGDGKTDIAVFRAATGFWYILQSQTVTVRTVPNFGAANDVPQSGDFDGDGKNDLCVVRVEGTQRGWFIQRSSDGVVTHTIFGNATGDSIFFFAKVDVDGDGKQDIMVSRAVNNQRVFYALRSSDGQLFTLPWGINTGTAATSDTAIVGDYDGDGKTDFVARRTDNGIYTWYIYQSSTGTGRAVQFGITGDQ